MTMLNVTYDATSKAISVVDESTKLGTGVYPTLTAAGGTYDATTNVYDPSYETYDPSQPWSILNGTAYSRRLGWYTTDSSLQSTIQATYGSDASIWIKIIGGSSELKSYLAIGKYGINDDNSTTLDTTIDAYSGIFGTDGQFGHLALGL